MQSNYNAVMLDLETLGTGNNAAIVSIGAVRFQLNVKQTEFTEDQLFYVPVDLEASMEQGLTADGDTIKWWMKQSDAARSAFQNGLKLFVALRMFKDFVPSVTTYIFGNSSMFDNIILRSAFKASNMRYPVTYRYDACYRTLCKITNVPFNGVEGTAHNALDDAKAQTKHLMAILEQHPWTKF